MCPIMQGVVLRNVWWVYLDVLDVWYDARHHIWPLIGLKMAPKWPQNAASVTYVTQIWPKHHVKNLQK